MLSDRQQNVLRVLVEEYIVRALPVGSRTLVERYNLGISSATVRNELSALEDEGYLVQPHTSSGRIPTDSGYRAFVDELLRAGEFNDEALVNELKASAGELDNIMEQMSRALVRLTDCMTLLIPPFSLSFTIKVLSLVGLSARRVLLVIVTQTGQVFNRQIDLEDELDGQELAHLQDMLNHALAGLDSSCAASVLAALKQEHSERSAVKIFDETLLCLNEQSVKMPHPLGMTQLLTQPEFSESTRLLPILEQLEDDTMLLHICQDAFNSDVPFIRIGHENTSEALAGVSLVASQFGKEGNQGLIAVIGPTRMNYSQVFKAVHAAKNILRDE